MKNLNTKINALIGLSILTVGLGGCENGNITVTDEAGTAEKVKVKKRGEARMDLFKECMILAAKMPRQADDDVSDIVSECSSSSYYMTNFIE